MKAVATDGCGRLWLAETPMPSTGPYDCLVRTRHCLFCSSTDRHIIEGSFDFDLNYPVILGHESVGQIIACGDKVRHFQEGDWVSRSYALYPDESIGMFSSGWGGFAEYGKVRDHRAESEDGGPPAAPYYRYMQKFPSSLSPEQAELIVCQKEIYSSVAKLDDPGDRSYLIAGAGVAGLLFAVFLKLRGAARVGVIARRKEALDTTRQLTRADETHLLTESRGAGQDRFDSLIDTTGSCATVGRLADEWLHPGGKVLSYAIYPPSTGPDIAEMLAPRYSWQRIDPAEAEAHDDVCDLLVHNKINCRGWIAERHPIQDYARAWEAVRAKKGVKIAIDFPHC